MFCEDLKAKKDCRKKQSESSESDHKNDELDI